MAAGPWNESLLNELSEVMRSASICGLGQAAPNPLVSVLKHFREDLSRPLGRW
jgi:NADH:ubiquinone oxidoreductase subunit F (NADH-binding)